MKNLCIVVTYLGTWWISSCSIISCSVNRNLFSRRAVVAGAHPNGWEMISLKETFLHNLRFWSPEGREFRHSWDFSTGSGFPSSRTDQKGFGCRLKGGNETSWPLMFQKTFLKGKKAHDLFIGPKLNFNCFEKAEKHSTHSVLFFWSSCQVGISLQVNRLVTELLYHLKYLH